MEYVGWKLKWFFGKLLNISMDDAGVMLWTGVAMMLLMLYAGLLIYLSEQENA